MAATWLVVVVIIESFISLLDAAILGVETDKTFADFIATHGRTYGDDTQEYKLRHKLYKQFVAQVEEHNNKPERRWTATVNEFADRTEAELAMLRGWRGLHRSTSGSSSNSGHVQKTSQKGFLLSRSSSVLPKEVSWASLKISQANTNQGNCGSCWAVTTATVLTANAEIRGIGRNFSAQDILDCTPNPFQCGGSGGCDGSTVEMAMNWIMEHGVKNMDQAPYEGNARACGNHAMDAVSALQSSVGLEEMTRVGFHGPRSMSSPGVLLGLRGWEHLPENKYLPLLNAVANTGPVAVSVGASTSWYWYWGGIYDSCSKDAIINHAVTLIGYGEDAERGDKYWIIKNSWGLVWGENGNIRLLRTDNDENSCGVDTSPSEGTGCSGGPPQVTVCGTCGILYDSVVPFFS